MTDTIDAFAHVFPESVYERMLDVHPSEEVRAIGSYFWDIENRLADLNEYGIDRQVLSLARPPVWREMDPESKLEMTRFANSAVREYADTNPDRFIPAGTIPEFGPEYVDETRRCFDELDMAGIQVFSNVDGNPIDSAAAEQIFGIVAANDGVVWLHPQLHDWHAWDDEYLLNKTLGWPFDTSLALCRLVYSGITATYPDLDIVAHHLGGMIPHFADRIELFAELMTNDPEMYPYSIPEFDRPPIEYFRDFYGDTVRASASSILEDGVDFFGDDHVLFATDYPFGPDEGRGFLESERNAVEQMDIEPDQRDQLLGANIERLLP